MKNTIKILGIIVLAIAVLFVACDTGGAGSRGNREPTERPPRPPRPPQEPEITLTPDAAPPSFSVARISFDIPFQVTTTADLSDPEYDLKRKIYITNPSDVPLIVLDIQFSIGVQKGGGGAVYVLLDGVAELDGEGDVVVDNIDPTALDGTLSNAVIIPAGEKVVFKLEVNDMSGDTADLEDMYNDILVFTFAWGGEDLIDEDPAGDGSAPPAIIADAVLEDGKALSKVLFILGTVVKGPAPNAPDLDVDDAYHNALTFSGSAPTDGEYILLPIKKSDIDPLGKWIVPGSYPDFKEFFDLIASDFDADPIERGNWQDYSVTPIDEDYEENDLVADEWYVFLVREKEEAKVRPGKIQVVIFQMEEGP